MIISDLVKQGRKDMRMTQRELALLSGVSIQRIRQIEQQFNENASLSTLIPIAKLLDIDLNLLKYR